ncbi:hypothetical protein ACLOJK_036448 [Asimina triloba]
MATHPNHVRLHQHHGSEIKRQFSSGRKTESTLIPIQVDRSMADPRIQQQPESQPIATSTKSRWVETHLAILVTKQPRQISYEVQAWKNRSSCPVAHANPSSPRSNRNSTIQQHPVANEQEQKTGTAMINFEQNGDPSPKPWRNPNGLKPISSKQPQIEQQKLPQYIWAELDG